MICRPCAQEADAAKSGIITHEERQRGNRLRKGFNLPPTGHAGCKGCDCRHQPVKGANG